jgi:hypothetical protein
VPPHGDDEEDGDDRDKDDEERSEDGNGDRGNGRLVVFNHDTTVGVDSR